VAKDYSRQAPIVTAGSTPGAHENARQSAETDLYLLFHGLFEAAIEALGLGMAIADGRQAELA
jgi:hypothetical protein